MTFDDLSQAHLYTNLIPGLDLAFDYLKSFKEDTDLGKYPLDGDRVFALVQGYQSYPTAERQFESHRRYLDVQYMVSGEELIFHSPLERLKPTTEYSDAEDVMLYGGPEDQALHMTPGKFAIFLPQDGHKPCIALAKSETIRKIVVKVRVA